MNGFEVLRLPPGQPVNLIPEAALVETYVRAVDEDSIREYSQSLDAAAAGGAAAIGVGVTAERIQGYAPFRADPRLHTLLRATAEARGVQFVEEPFSAASSDMGDVSRLKPSIIISFPGTNGRLHEGKFQVTDEQAAYVFPAEIVADFLRRLTAGPST